jgi:hypothetical protein
MPDTETRWDRWTHRLFQRDPPMWLFWAPALLMFIFIIAVPWPSPRERDDLPERRLARDVAAGVRAQAFVEALGFEPGPVVSRSTNGGSAWCTARVAGSDKTFSLWCSWRHPTCIENLARE